MTGVYSIVEVVDASNKKPEKTILCILDEEDGKKWIKSQRNSLSAIEDLVHSNGAWVFNNLKETITLLNNNY